MKTIFPEYYPVLPGKQNKDNSYSVEAVNMNRGDIKK